MRVVSELPDHAISGAEETLSMCSLEAGGRRFGIDTRSIHEVLGARHLQCVPLAPAFIGGVVAYRGEVLTTVSLRALLGLEPDAGESCVLVIDGEGDDDRFGLCVDAVGGVVTVQRSDFAENPSTLEEAGRVLFEGAFRMGGGLLVQLDPMRLQPSRLAATGLFTRAQGTRFMDRQGEGHQRCEL